MLVYNKVFISYSHDSQAHVDAVLSLANRLRLEGIDACIDQYEESPDEGWPRWMMNQIEQANFILVVCTSAYYRRFRGKEVPNKGLGANWEGAIITQELYEMALVNTKIIPVIFSGADKDNVPETLKAFTIYNLADPNGYESLYRRLTNQPRTPIPQLGTVQPLPEQQRKHSFQAMNTSTYQADEHLSRVSNTTTSPAWISGHLKDALMHYSSQRKGAVALSILTVLPFLFALELLLIVFLIEVAGRPIWLSVKTQNRFWLNKLIWTGGIALVSGAGFSILNTTNGLLSTITVLLQIPFIVRLLEYYTSDSVFKAT